ncbi:MAG: MBL fold metallo-hydrolase [Desulfobacterales bacterium]|jgi:glyoxylase-like metal-dependent hydrolase (beta-lactamase superfamily II)
MYGDIIEIAQNTLLVEGKIPSSIMKEPDIANSVVYKADNVLYIFDTGATAFFRSRLHLAIERLRPFKKVILLNSHCHPDHVGNNSILKEINGAETEHYISRAGIAGLEAEKDFLRKFQNIDQYYDFLEGPAKFPATLLRLLKITRILGEDLPVHILVKNTLKKFMPLEPNTEAVMPLERTNAVKLTIGNTDWTGWNFNHHVYVMKAQGHSPDEVVFFLPEVKVLVLADETFEFFNCWPDSSSTKVKVVLHKSLQLFQSQAAEILISGHTHQVFSGTDAIQFLQTLLQEYEEFTGQILAIARNAPNGLTVNDIYNKLKKLKSHPVITKYINLEFPKMPPFLKTVITSILLENGFKAAGKTRKKRFVP